ncbi:MAG: hypothetical protein PVJ67_05355 [Candidatus Pacearchaeota archaeon]|jgi:hypothetical protein
MESNQENDILDLINNLCGEMEKVAKGIRADYDKIIYKRCGYENIERALKKHFEEVDFFKKQIVCNRKKLETVAGDSN